MIKITSLKGARADGVLMVFPESPFFFWQSKSQFFGCTKYHIKNFHLDSAIRSRESYPKRGSNMYCKCKSYTNYIMINEYYITTLPLVWKMTGFIFSIGLSHFKIGNCLPSFKFPEATKRAKLGVC